MKICLIAPLFDPWLVGGAEKYAKTLAEKLSEDHQVIVITTTGPVPRKQIQSNNNLKVIEINPGNIATLYDMIDDSASIGSAKKMMWHFFDLWNLSSYLKIKKILKDEKPDVIHTNGIKGFSPTLFSAIKHLQIPHVHTIHDYELISRWMVLYRNGKPISNFNIFDRIYMSYFRKMSSGLDAVIAPSKFAMNLHEKLGFFRNSQKYIIPNGGKLDKDAKPKSEFKSEFLFLGQIIESKGLHIAVKAFRKVKDKNAILHIAGKGQYLDTIKLLAKGDERIIFHGFLDEEELEKIFKKCSYLLVPSVWYEIFGLVIMEAMNKGLPVIASNIGAIPELVKDRYNGYLFEAGNVDSLCDVIERSINENTEYSRLSKNAIETSKNFDLEGQIKSILKIYSQLNKKT